MGAQLRARLRRLERSLLLPGGRCPQCPGPVVVFYRQDSPEAEPVLEEGQELPRPCPGCRKLPDVHNIIEVVVCSQEDLQRLDALADGPQAKGPEPGPP